MDLLTPIEIGSITVPNRVVSTAHGAFLDAYRPGVSDAQYLAYQERRARGGCGLIILQALSVHPSSQTAGHYMWERDDILPKFLRMSEQIHAHGTKVVLQIAHFGAQFRSDGNEDLSPLWGFSPMISPSGSEVAHQMTAAEVEEVIEGFVRTALIAVEGGLDGVELHATHGYLLQQSFSEWANTRADGWGEPLRFLDEVMGRVREAVGTEPVVGLRISADDWIPFSRGGLGPDGLRAVAGHVCESGLVDYLNHSEGSRSAHYARAIADYYGTPGEFLPLTAGLRRVANGVPVIGVGKIMSPAQAEQALTDGSCDLVGMTRAQIADPDVVIKTRRQEMDRIRPCVGSNSGCVDRMEGSLPITCFHNPDVGREWRLPALDTVADSKRVLVIGAGPAGLKAAEIAARRGHDVTVLDRDVKPGGRLKRVLPLGAPSAMFGAIDWLMEELDLLGVDIRMEVDGDDSTIVGFDPDAIILATGAEGALFGGDTDDTVQVMSVDNAMDGDLSDSRVVIVDQLGLEEQALCAEYLARRGADVHIVTPFPMIGANIGFTHVRGTLERLFAVGVTMLTSTIAISALGGEVQTRHVYSKESSSIAADSLVVAGVRRPVLDLEEVARSVCNTVILAGDVVAPRTALQAFREGDNAGRAV